MEFEAKIASEETALQVMDAQATQATVSRSQTQYTTAMQVVRPRSLEVVTSRVIEEARCGRSRMYYAWTQAGKLIEGPSIDLAMCIARNFGNCVLDCQVEETGTHYLFKALFVDLETGFTNPHLFRQRKSQSLSKKMDAERQEDIVFQIGQSKAKRGAVIKAVPSFLVDRAMEEAKKAEIQGIKAESPVVARAKVIEFFSQYGITVDQIEDKCGRPAERWTPEDIATFRAMATGIREGRIAAAEIFSDPQDVPQQEQKKRGRPRTKDVQDPQEQQPDSPKEEFVACKDGELIMKSYCEKECLEREGCESVK